MRRYRKKRTKRPIRRRRYSRRRRSLTVKPDGIHKEKIVFQMQLFNSDANGGYMNFHWHESLPNVPNRNVGYATNNGQFGNIMNLYEYYYPYGLSIRWIPRVFG